MNLLAHLHLSEGRPVAVAAGNLLADFMRRFGARDLDPDFHAGVRLHRSIDAYTEAHPVARRARACISPARRRLAGIIVDVAFDHFLARNWAQYSPQPLPDYAAARLAAIGRYLAPHDSPLGPVVERARREEWLLAYGTAPGLRLTFNRIASRSPAAAPLRGAEEEIAAQGAPLQHAFAEFYPQLIARFA